MKQKTLMPIALTICLMVIIIWILPSSQVLKTGAISFESMNAQNDEFSIKMQEIIPPNTRIYFTDTEWNGTHLGIDEHTLLWNSGKDSIPIGDVIYFKNQNSYTTPSIGSAQGILKIAFKRDAIFAYQGTERMPIRFIAGIAYHTSDYGTLNNTGLIIGSTALLLP